MEVIKEQPNIAPKVLEWENNNPLKEASTEAKGSQKSCSPPAMITVDTKKTVDERQDASQKESAEDCSFRQEATPKHANKNMRARYAAEAQKDGTQAEGTNLFPTQEKSKFPSDQPPIGRPGRPSYRDSQCPPTMGGNNGVFPPHTSQYKDRGAFNHPAYYNGRGPQVTVSPGGNGSGYHNREGQGYRGGYPPQYPPDSRGLPSQQGYMDHRSGDSHYSRGRYEQTPYGVPPQAGGHYGGQLFPPNQGPNPTSYNRGPPPLGYREQHNGFNVPSSGEPPHSYQGHHPPYGGHHQHAPTQEGPESHFPQNGHSNVSEFTRAVSSSFDNKSAEHDNGNHHGPPGGLKLDSTWGHPSHRNQDGNGSIAPSDDSSWRQLNQVASIDDDAIRESLKKHKDETYGNADTSPQQPGSSSSSLTNSPTDHQNMNSDSLKNISKHPPNLPTPSKLAPLDSLSSVASAQEPMDTQGSKGGKSRTGQSSPELSTMSLDLMKCSSGSSGLLQGFHEGSLESVNLEYPIENKRSREQRGDMDFKSSGREDDEIRKAPSGEDQLEINPSKRLRSRSELKASVEKNSNKKGSKNRGSKVKSSTSSIVCSPPDSPKSVKQREQHDRKVAHSKNSSNGKFANNSSSAPPGTSYFDQAPSYAYSLESVPSFENRKRDFPSLPHQSSASSSTITPMLTSNDEGGQRDGVGPSLLSWDLAPQDSFGGGSTGTGVGLMSSFSFTQDYPMLANSNSFSGAQDSSGSVSQPGAYTSQLPPPPPPTTIGKISTGPPQERQNGVPPPYVAESRNQSFEGGNYHGSFDRSRSDSQGASYSGQGSRQGGPQTYNNDNYNGSQQGGKFTPHAPSWGTTASGNSGAPPLHNSQYRGPPPGIAPPPIFNQYNPNQQQRTGPPGPHSPQAPHHYQNGPMMRNYSEDSTMRGSPPLIPHMMHNGQLSRGGPPPQGNNSMSAQLAFQPPPEFSAPQNPHIARCPPPEVYMMSSPSGGHGPHTDSSLIPKRGPAGGVYSWTKEDDDRLTDVMKKYKNPLDWEPIAKEHGRGKTAKECHERWIRYLKPGVRKGQWQDHEDAIVVEAVTTSSEQPFTRWSDLAQRLPGRVGKQIRDRWVNHLNPNINHLPFSREDDLNLWNGHTKLGKRWVEISTKFFKQSRSENHIKNRWYSASFKKFISNEFGPDAYSGGKPPGKGDKKGKKMKFEAENEAMIDVV